MIDSHVHLWRIGANGHSWPTPDLPAIHRDFLLDDWRALPGAAAVDGVVLVQSQPDARDTAWLLEVAASAPQVLAVTGWADADAPDAVATVERLARAPKLRALRPMVQDLAADWYDDSARDRVWDAMARAGLVLEALVRPRHLPSLVRLATRHPDLAIVIDHGAKPVLDDLAPWRADLAALAALPRVRCKLSGLLTERRPGDPPEAIAPAAAALVALFAPDRLMWGSDWPVLALAGDYAGWQAQARALVPPEHHRAVFDATARATYGIIA
ncbi:amidohydrolase family protein [Sphingomonas sp. RHCKR7]|uniref:amidohydrolase family protein n=1 Tax=Sphingomonas folli TaxID=2862497 RepID=UPI001CA51B41|nr:amidohydrolase family protein [Sphingomonas folli]MBW6527040.1 amidohydrolase family protein [Sphingomonas folli]